MSDKYDVVVIDEEAEYVRQHFVTNTMSRYLEPVFKKIQNTGSK